MTVALILLALVVAVQCILISQMDKGHSTLTVLHDREARTIDAVREHRTRAEEQMLRVADCTQRGESGWRDE
ncbi:hypothetical protein [Parafrankia sp. FMc2]|uniref:hypothetical protein n=1 Tax=Parafrankia sp. FMc2 TaxID=3233196 RepID=UPI0034D5F733